MFERHGLALPVGATMAIHAILAAGLGVADVYVKTRPAPKPMVLMEIVEKAPEPPPPPEVAEPEPPPPPPPPPEPEPQAPPPPEKKVAKVLDDPPPPSEAPPPAADEPPPPAEPPAPGPVSDTPAPYVYRMDGPTVGGTGMPVAGGGRPTGNLHGKKGGTGDQRGGGGGPPDSTGTGGPVASVAAVKVMPRPIGDYDRLGKDDYPPAAMKNGVEGSVTVRVLVDEHGRVSEAKLVKGVGFGLDEKALQLARRLRFEPARDTADRPVSVRISWTFHFTLPE